MQFIEAKQAQVESLVVLRLIRTAGACPGKVVAETEGEVWKLMELHAKIAHDEDASEWDEETRPI